MIAALKMLPGMEDRGKDGEMRAKGDRDIHAEAP